MLIVCDGIRTYTREPWRDIHWHDLEFGTRLRKFIIYNDNNVLIAIGICRGFATPAMYKVQINGKMQVVANTRLKTVMRDFITSRIGWHQIAKTMVMCVTIMPENP